MQNKKLIEMLPKAVKSSVERHRSSRVWVIEDCSICLRRKRALIIVPNDGIDNYYYSTYYGLNKSCEREIGCMRYVVWKSNESMIKQLYCNRRRKYYIYYMIKAIKLYPIVFYRENITKINIS